MVQITFQIDEKKVEKLLDENKGSATNLARYLGISMPQVYKMFQNGKTIRRSTLLKIAKKIDRSFDEVVEMLIK